MPSLRFSLIWGLTAGVSYMLLVLIVMIYEKGFKEGFIGVATDSGFLGIFSIPGGILVIAITALAPLYLFCILRLVYLYSAKRFKEKAVHRRMLEVKELHTTGIYTQAEFEVEILKLKQSINN